MAAIIFDFDGTIADSFDYVADFLAAEAGIELSPEQRKELRGLSMLGMARQIGFRWWRLPGLFFKGRRRMTKIIRHLEPFTGMPEVIRKLQAEGHQLFLLSSNSLRNVRRFLHHHKLHKYFLEIYGGVGLFGKAPALRKLIQENGLDAKHTVYVGDELRDVEAAQSIDLKIVAVQWGFAPTAVLKDQKPTALVSSPEELMSVLEEL
jgi:phosphoglycolate phosphatase